MTVVRTRSIEVLAATLIVVAAPALFVGRGVPLSMGLGYASLVAGLAAWMGAIKGGSDRDAGRVWGGLSRRRT